MCACSIYFPHSKRFLLSFRGEKGYTLEPWNTYLSLRRMSRKRLPLVFNHQKHYQDFFAKHVELSNFVEISTWTDITDLILKLQSASWSAHWWHICSSPGTVRTQKAQKGKIQHRAWEDTFCYAKNTIKMYDSALRTQRSEPQIEVIVGGMISHNLRTVSSAVTGLLHMPASQNALLTGKLGLKSKLGSSSKDKLIVTLVSPHSFTHSFIP